MRLFIFKYSELSAVCTTGRKIDKKGQPTGRWNLKGKSDFN